MIDEDSLKGVLLVITDEEERQALQKLFHGEQFDVHAVVEAADALALLAAHLIPFVICDLRLGRFSGFDLLTEIKDLYPAVPIVMLCEEADINEAVACMRAGAFSCITKPYDNRHLLDLVESAVVMKIHETVQFDRTAKLIANYTVVCKIGDGSMGVVYLVQKESQRYAMKLLRVPPDEEDTIYELRERFMREARYASEIDNPHVIKIVEYGIAGKEERPFIVMELLEGVTLSEISIRRPNLTYRQQADLLRQIALALSAIHEKGIFHRDIKPSNVMVNDYLHATVMDFGLVYMPESELTLAEELLGSPAYLSPEAFSNPGIDARGDLFSFGVLAYEFLLCELPFQGPDIPSTMLQITMDRPIEPQSLQPGFPTALQNILARLLKKKPDDRYQTAEDVMRDLEAYLDDEQAEVAATSFVGVDWKLPD